MDVPELLRRIVGIWDAQLDLCRKAKERDFAKDARQHWSFLGKSFRQLYIETSDQDLRFSDAKGLHYKPRINKSAEAVGLIAPHCLSRVPHRLVTPRRPPLPAEVLQLIPAAGQARQVVDARDELNAYLLQWYLNYTPTEFGLYGEARKALVEAIVKGRGVLWHEMADGAAGAMPASYFESVDNLFIDSDVTQLRDAGFILRKRRLSVWKVSEMFGQPRERLRAQAKSNMQQATDIAQRESLGGAKPEDENDICEYYEVWSRVGIGHWLERDNDVFRQLNDTLDALGPNVWLAIMPGMEYPLNLSPESLTGAESIAELQARLEWPIAFWAETAGNPWPCSTLDLLPACDNPWAISPLQAGLPMQIFLDHLYSFIMNRIRVSSKSLILVSKALEEQVNKAILEGFDLELVTCTGKPGDELESLVKLFEFPELNQDLWRVLQVVEAAYEKATALDSLLYGGPQATKPQMRSATEAGIREAHVNTRPDDYAASTESWMSMVAAKEGQAARLHVREEIAPLFGEPLPNFDDPEVPEVYGPLTAAWLKLVATDDPGVAAAELAYTIEAGSGRRKNKQKQVQDMQQLVQLLVQPLLEFAGATGNPEPFNALLETVGETLEMPLDRLMLPPMQPAPPEGQGKEK